MDQKCNERNEMKIVFTFETKLKQSHVAEFKPRLGHRASTAKNDESLSCTS